MTHVRLTLGATLAVSLLALAPTPSITEYVLPRPRAFPHDPAVGRDGMVWYTDQVNSYIGRLDPATGQVTDYATPTPASGPHGIVVAPDGAVWYTANFTGRVGRLDPVTGRIMEYVLPAKARDPHTPLFHNGKVWFTAQGANSFGVGRINPADGALREFTLPAADARPRRLVVDARGIVWYTDFARGTLGRLDPATGQVRDFASPGGADSRPYGIAISPDGRIWYDESAKDDIAVFDPATERAETVPIPTHGSVVRNMSVDSTRARLWLALSGIQRLGRIDLTAR